MGAAILRGLDDAVATNATDMIAIREGMA